MSRCHLPAGVVDLYVHCKRCDRDYNPGWETCSCDPDAHWVQCRICDREIDWNEAEREGRITEYAEAICEKCWTDEQLEMAERLAKQPNPEGQSLETSPTPGAAPDPAVPLSGPPSGGAE